MRVVQRNESKNVAQTQTMRRHRPDYSLLVLPLILLTIGLVVVFAISPGLAVTNNGDGSYFVKKQLLAIVISILLFIATASLKLRYWRLIGIISGVIAAILIGITIAISLISGEATRWIQIGGLSFQPTEVVKLALLLLLADFLARQDRLGKLRDVRATLRPILVAAGLVGAIIVFVQKDLGSTLVMVLMVAAMMAVAGVPIKRLLLIGSAVLLLTGIAISTTPYRRDRLLTFLHPERDMQGVGWHVNQALIAVGSGGLMGLGLGNSVQAFGYLPKAENDSIFAVYAEKFGFIGSITLLVLYGVLLKKMLDIADVAGDMRMRLGSVGILMWIGIQTTMNVGAMIGLLPLKGITLPLISYGGTSMVFIMAALGLLFNMSRYTHLSKSSSQRRSPYDYPNDWRGNGGSRYATVSRRARN